MDAVERVMAWRYHVATYLCTVRNGGVLSGTCAWHVVAAFSKLNPAVL